MQFDDLTLISCRLSNQRQGAPPLGPMYLVSVLRSLGWSVSLVDFQTVTGSHIFDIPGLVKTIHETTGPVVGISLFSDALPLVLASIRAHNSTYTRRAFILGGPGVNGNEHDILTLYPEVDAIVRGEGETVLPEVLLALREGKAPSGPGIFSRSKGNGDQGISPRRIEDLDKIPRPDFESLDLTLYSRVPIVTSRGCPFDCSFCEIITMWGRSTGFRSVPDVIAELGHLVSIAPNLPIDFIDDTFTLNRKRVLTLCDQIVSQGYTFRWTCFSRIDTIDEEMMAAMAAAGCYNVFYGIDTGSELIWRGINKRLSREQVMRTVATSLKYFDVTASYIWGYPEETLADFSDTVDLSFDVACILGERRVTTQLHFLSPTRATPIFSQWGNTLRLSESVELEILGGSPLRRHRNRPGYQTCIDLIRSNRDLFASFYYYDSPDLEEKMAIVRSAQGIVVNSSGRRLLAGNSRDTACRELERCLATAQSGTPHERLSARIAYPRVREGDECQLSSLFEGF